MRSAIFATFLLFASTSAAHALNLVPGNLVVGSNDGLIVQFDSSGDVVDGLFGPESINSLGIDSNGEIVIGTQDFFNPSAIIRIDANGNVVESFPNPVSFHQSLAFSPNGDILLGNDTQILRMDASGAFLDVYLAPFALGGAPSLPGLAVEANGNILAASFSQNGRRSLISRLGPDGEFLEDLGEFEFFISGLAVALNGDILFANRLTDGSGFFVGSEITRLDSSGAVLGSFVIPVDVNGMDIVPVPEPTTALLLAFGLVALCVRRQAQPDARDW